MLEARQADQAFRAQHFMWHAARALIPSARGEPAQAGAERRMVLAAAEQSASGFRNHQSLGLVGDSFRGLRDRLRALSTDIAPGP